MIKIIRVCRKRMHRIAQRAAGKSHIAYLAIATLVDGSIYLRVACGSCLIFCVLVTVFEEHEMREEAQQQ